MSAPEKLSPTGPEVIPVAELHARLKAQGVSAREHAAVKCVVCGNVQSIASMMKAGATPDDAERLVSQACEGRLTNAGPWPSSKDKTKKAAARRKIRGCDWALYGLFHIHRLEVETPDGSRHPCFEVATPEEAQALEQVITDAGRKALEEQS